MGKLNDEKTSSNEFKQLLLPEDKRNYLLCSSTSSSIKDSLSNSSPASTTSHLSEYSQNSDKQNENQLKSNNRNETKLINIKENKLNKENYLLLLNDLENLKSYQKHHNSSPSTKSSSINSLNQLIKSSPSINSSNLKSRQINRSLTFLDGRNNSEINSINTSELLTSNNNDKFNKLSKSKSTQNQNINAFETNNLLQSYSAVFNDRYIDNRKLDNQIQFDNQLNSISKLNFKDNFYRKWFLNRFKNGNNEFNFEQTANTKSKKPKLINLKRYSSIDLNRTNDEQKQSNYDKINDKENDLSAGPSGLNQDKKRINGDKNYLRTEFKQITNPLHPYYLDTVNCVGRDIDIDMWTTTASSNINNNETIANSTNTNSNSSLNDDCLDNRNAQNSSSNYSTTESNYSTLVCGTSLMPKKISEKLKRNNNNNQSVEQQNKNTTNKKPILLPKLHNEYCTNTNSSHHHHHSKHHHSTESISNCSTTRSDSSNISCSSTDEKINANKTTTDKDKSTNDDLSGSLSSVVSTDPEKFCKICHLNGRDEDPLISPCKCAGTMQFIHCRCLMRWLEISKKKSRKPLSCELCQYQYQWHKKFKVGHWQFPKCSRKDKFLHIAFIISVIIMICCALSIIVFFKLQEPAYRVVDPRRYDLTINEPVTVGFAMIFVFSFCLSLYAQVKARTTLYRLIMNFIYLNQQWYINEYEKNIKENNKDLSSSPEVV